MSTSLREPVAKPDPPIYNRNNSDPEKFRDHEGSLNNGKFLEKNFMKKLFLTLLMLGICWSGLDTLAAQEKPFAKNVVLMIGDGMGFNSDWAGTLYRYGQPGAQIYQKFPKVLGCSTYNVTEKGAQTIQEGSKEKLLQGYRPEIFWSKYLGGREGTEYTSTTDSAASSTAINSGMKTKTGSIGVTYDQKPLKQFALYAVESGRSIGTVTTVTLCHATPAGVIAHNKTRGKYEEIAKEMISEQPMTVIMGAGHPEYHHGKKIGKDPAKFDYQYVGGRDLWEKIKKNEIGMTLIEKKKDFAKIAESTPDKKTDLPKRLLGIPRENGSIKPIDGGVGENGRKLADKLIRKEVRDTVPTLSIMSLAALNVLNQNPKGFFLMIEGGAIDGANHGNNMEMMVLEHTGFSKAIDAVCDWIEKYSSWDETLLIITADHETGQLWGPETWKSKKNEKTFQPGDEFLGFKKIVNNGRGNLPGYQYGYKSHTNALVPFYVKGAGCDWIDGFVRGLDSKAAEFWNFSGKYIDNTDITPFMKKAAGLDSVK